MRSSGFLMFGVCALALLAHPGFAADLKAGFANPPVEAKPQVWWHWLDGNISTDGAKRDLAWMNQLGVGGVHIFSGGGLSKPVVDVPSPFMSPAWKDTLRTALQEAKANGMEVTIAGSPGWSETGGPWVAPKDAMKKYVWSETRVQGGAKGTIVLAHPPIVTGPFQSNSINLKTYGARADAWQAYGDAAVIAFPTPVSEATAPPFTVVTSSVSKSSAELADLSARKPVAVAANAEGVGSLDITYSAPAVVGAVTLSVADRADVVILVSDNGQDYRAVGGGMMDNADPASPLQTYSFTPQSTRFLRILLKPTPATHHSPFTAARDAQLPKKYAVTSLEMVHGARVNRFEGKAGFAPSFSFEHNETATASEGTVVPGASVLDLTSKLQPDGRLDWSAPMGNWTVLRIGWSLTGRTNGPAERDATGLEVDKLDSQAVEDYLTQYLALYKGAIGNDLLDAGINHLLTDSWEAGPQNWTPGLLDAFKQRQGYDPVKFLPALAGYVVDSAEQSDRFLWDFRQTLKGMLADNHYGAIAKVLHANGLQYYTEAEGDTPRSIGDGLSIKARSDIPTGEFWYRAFATAPGQPSLQADLEEAASAAHLYGKPLVAAEAMTVAAQADPWAFSPGMLKPVADEIFAHGVNRILIHDSVQQPFADKAPGLTLSIFGQYFNRNDTWAADAGPWVAYLARTSYLLQRGQFVADIAYFYGEEENLTERFENHFDTGVPAGYGYDFVNAEALTKALSVKDGRLVTDSGMRYRLLYVPVDVNRYTLLTLQRLRDLVSQGATLVAVKPKGSLGIASTDAAIVALADEIWGESTSATTDHALGLGHVFGTADLSAVLDRLPLTPDVALSGQTPGTRLLSLHRRDGEAEIYFLSNQSKVAQTLKATFRVQGKTAELWHADTGKIEPTSYSLTEKGTEVPVSLAPDEAVFIVFRDRTNVTSWVAPKARALELRTIAGPWQVTFQAGRGAPAEQTFATLSSWSDSPDSGIRYFSGSATYRQTLTVPKTWLRAHREVMLDLGEVKEVAAVSVNGKPVATAWHAPYVVDVSQALRPGKNLIEIRVSNLWPNRLIGDKQTGTQPYTFAPMNSYKVNSPLLPSGLLGPVRLIANDPAPASTQ